MSHHVTEDNAGADNTPRQENTGGGGNHNAPTEAHSSGATAPTPQGELNTALAAAGESAHGTKESVNQASTAVQGFLKGDVNIVDAALAVKGAVDSIKGLSGKLSEAAMMPVMKALGAFKGQAILPAAKQMDPVMGTDVHMVTIPPSPAPIPMPHPYIGILFNAKDFVSCAINTFKKQALDAIPAPAEGAPGLGAALAKNKEAIAGIAMGLAGMSASVKFGDFIPRAITGTPCKSIPHIPMGAGFFPAFEAAIAKNNGKAFLGSLFVVADGDPMVGSFHLNYDCWDIGVPDLFKALRGGKMKKPAPPEPGSPKAELFVPSGIVTPIPIGRPVLVNSIPTPINPLGILDKLFKSALGKLKAAAAKAARNAAQKGLNSLNGKVGCGPLTAASRLIGTSQSHPVDVASGHFYTDNIDFKLPGPIPFSWERIWYSYSSYNGPLGHGWHHSYDMALAIDAETQTAILRMSDGRVAHFELPEAGKETYNRGEKLTLCVYEDGYYYVTDKKSLIYRFTQQPVKNPFNNTETHLLQSIANRNGFAIRFAYDKDATLTQITDSAGRKLKVNNDGKGKITNIEAPDPRYQGRSTFAITGYTYSDENDMSSQADALDQRMLFWYENHLMAKETWRNGCNWHFKYDKPAGIDAKCIEVWGTGGLLHYKFDYTDRQCTVVINSRGFKKLFYHKNGVVIKHIDALGNPWEYRFNQFNELEWETDPLGNQKSIVYDQWGNKSLLTEPNGAFFEIKYGDGILKHFPIESTDKIGGKWKWNYNDKGDLIKRINPLKTEVRYLYEDGILKKILSTNENAISLDYDLHYNLNRIIYPNSFAKFLTYDTLGNCTKSSDSRNNIRKVQFNILSLPEIIHEADGNIRYLKFNAESKIVTAKDQHSDIRFGYDYLNRLTYRNQNSHIVAFKFDSESNLIQKTNENDEVYNFEIDAADMVISETGFDGSTRKYTRNSIGKVTRVHRPGGKFTDFKYDEVGNIIEKRYHDYSVEKYQYSKDGSLLYAENSGSKVEWERDSLSRITKELSEEGFIDYRYDAFDNRTEITSSLGPKIENEVNELGKLIGTKTNNWQSATSYDEAGFEVEILLPGFLKSEFARDKLGRLTNHNVRNRDVVIHTRRYNWEPNQRLKRIEDSTTGVTTFFHDEIGNLVKTIFSDGEEEFRNPDSVGNLYKTLNRSDRKYGRGSRLLSVYKKVYKYDEEGNLIEKKDENGKSWKYTWNAKGMLESVLRPDNDVVSFTYDALGRRLTKKYRNTITKWVWDGNVPLHEWKENEKTNQILNTALEKDGITTWLFKEDNYSIVGKLKNEKAYSFITDHLGTSYQMYNQVGEKLWESQLDTYGKAIVTKGEVNSCPFRYQGQYEDYETGLYYNRFRYYDPEDGLYLSQDPIRLGGTNPTLYSYVKDPNSWLDIFGLACGEHVVYVLKDANNNVVYIGITSRNPAIRSREHKRAGKEFDHMEVVARVGSKDEARDIEGSGLYHRSNDPNMQNRSRSDANNEGDFYHSYSGDNVTHDRDECDSMFNNPSNERIPKS